MRLGLWELGDKRSTFGFDKKVNERAVPLRERSPEQKPTQKMMGE